MSPAGKPYKAVVTRRPSGQWGWQVGLVDRHIAAGSAFTKRGAWRRAKRAAREHAARQVDPNRGERWIG